MRSVLVVDDDGGFRQTLRYILEDAGYTVYEAPDGEPALRFLRKRSEGMVVLLDFRMPGMDGRQVLEAVAADETLRTRHVYALVTANADALPLGFASLLLQLRVSVVLKPFDIGQLLHVVAQEAARLDNAAAK